MSQVNEALGAFDHGYNCAQSVFAAYAPTLGMDEQTAARVAAAFGGGIARTGGICGALSGALMVIGLRHGATSPEDQVAKQHCYEVAQELIRRFNQEQGATCCRDILGLDFGTPEGQAAAKARDVHHTVCPGCVRTAARLLDELLNR